MDISENSHERRVKGLAVSRGIGVGPVRFLDVQYGHRGKTTVDTDQVSVQIARLRMAIAESVEQLRILSSDNGANSEGAAIFDVHLLILEGSSFVSKVESMIAAKAVDAETALGLVADRYILEQTTADAGHIGEKHLDIGDVAARVLGCLGSAPITAQKAYEGMVVVARELRPSDVMKFADGKPAALVTERGGWTSHASILARELDLPMVSGIRDPEERFARDDVVVVDGFGGEVVIDPTNETIEHFAGITLVDHAAVSDLDIVNVELRTQDGAEVILRTNVDSTAAYLVARRAGVSGIGLYRSESLISAPGAVPSEDEQIRAYCSIATAAGEHGVKIRTFDAGSELMSSDGSLERNPALGLRAIRHSFAYDSHFRTQIRAILQASAAGNIDIVLPLVPGVAEIHACKRIIGEESSRLESEGIAHGSPKVGAMIEIPAAVLLAGDIAGTVDFLCLGTNDLVQYLLGVDRDNDGVADWYQTLHPAVLIAIARVLDAGREAAIPVTVCGEMAGSTFYVPLLLGLGTRELSVNAAAVYHIRRLISGISVSDATSLADRARHCKNAADVEGLLRSYYLDHWSGLFPPGILASRHR